MYLIYGFLDQVWYLIVSIPDLCTLTYFVQYSITTQGSPVGFNPFKPSLLAYPYQEDAPISTFRGMWWYIFHLLFFKLFVEHCVSKQ